MFRALTRRIDEKYDVDIRCRNTAWDLLQKKKILWTLMIKYIPRKEVKCKKSSHPWMNSRCEKVIFEKMNAEGSEQYEEKSKRCSEVLQEERSKYTEKLKAKLASLPRSSKQWWRINRELLQRKAKISSIPPLRDGTTWLMNAKEKADAFAKTFVSKMNCPQKLLTRPFLVLRTWDLTNSFPCEVERQSSC